MKISGFLLFILLLNPDTILARNGRNLAPETLRNYSLLNTHAERFNNGFFSLTEINMAFGLNAVHAPYSEHFFGATTAAGYQFNYSTYAGIGAGMFDYSNGLMFPLFLHGRYYFSSMRLSPFITGDCGIMLPLRGAESESRMYVNPGVGIVVSSTKTIELSLAASLLSQWEKNVRRDSFLNLKIGMTFLWP